MKYLVLLFALMLPTCALADDCKPIKDALAKLETRAVIVKTAKRQWSPQGQCRLAVGIGIHSPHAEIIEPDVVEKIGALSDDAKCTALGPATLKGEAAQHYYASSGAMARIGHLWSSRFRLAADGSLRRSKRFRIRNSL